MSMFIIPRVLDAILLSTFFVKPVRKIYIYIYTHTCTRFLVSLKDFSLIWRRHHNWWRASNFDPWAFCYKKNISISFTIIFQTACHFALVSGLKFPYNDHNKDNDWILDLNEICISNTMTNRILRVSSTVL